MNAKSNKEIVMHFWKEAIGGRDVAVAESLISPEYIQHSASGKDGKQALLDALEQLKRMPLPEKSGPPFRRVIADGDFVATHMLIEFGAVKMCVLDLVRLENGLFVEHWDAIQLLPSLENPIKAIEGQVEITDQDLTEINKNVIRAFLESVLLKHDVAGLCVDNPVEHEVNENGDTLNWLEFIARRQAVKIHNIIGEGCFVIAQLSGLTNGASTVFYDVYRLEEHKIAEHWNVQQRIPEVMGHGNGMV